MNESSYYRSLSSLSKVIILIESYHLYRILSIYTSNPSFYHEYLTPEHCFILCYNVSLLRNDTCSLIFHLIFLRFMLRCFLYVFLCSLISIQVSSFLLVTFDTTVIRLDSVRDPFAKTLRPPLRSYVGLHWEGQRNAYS